MRTCITINIKRHKGLRVIDIEVPEGFSDAEIIGYIEIAKNKAISDLVK